MHSQQALDMPLPALPRAFNMEFFKQNGNLWFAETTEVVSASTAMVTGFGEMIVLGGYSYLGLNGHPRINEAVIRAIERFGTGTTGARFLTGTISLHNELEREIAAFKEADDAIVFTSGYMANVATISTLAGENAVIISDQLNHASIIDGCRYAKASRLRYAHNDLDDLERQLRTASSAAFRLVIVDSVFSMDGDIVDLPAVSELCRRHGAYLMVDEAHSTGVLGATGRGIEEHFGLPSSAVDVKMGTLSKAIPANGGYIAGNRRLIDFLKSAARGFTYSGALPPTSTAAAIAAIQVIRDEPERVQRLQHNFTHFADMSRSLGLNVLGKGTPIVPILCGDAEKACRLALYCADHGVFVHAVTSPVVAEGAARLRCSVTAAHTIEELDRCAQTIARGARELGLLLQ